MKRSIFDLALDFHRSPLQHPELMDSTIPLPPDIGLLLDAVIDNKDPEGGSPGELAQDLRAAIAFLIERALFVPGADCYRILGLNYGAKSEEIRKHYNQLLHIFSFDQVDKAGEWDAHFATQINRAYSVLRDPERRRAYDQTLIQSGGGKEAPRRVEQEKTASEGAESSRSAGKVSYLGSTVSVAKSVAEESGLRDQRQAVKGAARIGARSGEFERPGVDPPPSRTSFIANRIDRIDRMSGNPDGVDVGAADQVSPGADFDRPVAGDPVDARMPFPKGIPASVSHEGAPRHRRVLSMDRSSLALLAAVVLVLVVYAVVLPNHFSGGGGPESTGDRPVESETGSIVREEPASAPTDLAGTVTLGDGVGQGLPAGSETDRGGTNATVADAVDTRAIPGKQQPAALSSSASLPAEQDKRSQKSAVKPDTGGAARAGEGRSDAAPEGASPARKLESLRQTLQENAVGPYALQTQPDAPTRKKSARTDAAPKAAAGPSSGTAKVESPVPAQSSGSGAEKDVLRSKEDSGSPVVVAPPAPTPVPEAGRDQPAVAPAVVAAVEPPVRQEPEPTSISIQELDRLAATFSRAYEAGDLDLLLNLFAEDARTNDQADKAGIAKDYRELFQLSDSRRFIIDRLRWEQDKNGGLKGEGDFQVDVRLKGGGENSVKGKVIFYVRKGPGGLLIAEMIHSYN